MKFDIIVIGSGARRLRRGDPGGAAWAQSCRRGARALGGICLNWALFRQRRFCVPRKLGEDAGGIDPRRFPRPHALRNDACGRPRPGNSQIALRKMRSLQTSGARRYAPHASPPRSLKMAWLTLRDKKALEGASNPPREVRRPRSLIRPLTAIYCEPRSSYVE